MLVFFKKNFVMLILFFRIMATYLNYVSVAHVLNFGSFKFYNKKKVKLVVKCVSLIVQLGHS
jgi:hypothetical protein